MSNLLNQLEKPLTKSRAYRWDAVFTAKTAGIKSPKAAWGEYTAGTNEITNDALLSARDVLATTLKVKPTDITFATFVLKGL